MIKTVGNVCSHGILSEICPVYSEGDLTTVPVVVLHECS